MVESIIIRFLARLMALGALTGSFILLLVCNVGVPVYTGGPWTNYSITKFDDGGLLQLGIWGVCYTPSGGGIQCTKTSVGYNYSPSSLPNYSVNPGSANVNIVYKPLSESLIWIPLATASTGLANLLVLLPIRIVTILCIIATFLAIGATAISFVLAIINFSQANARLGLLFNPNNSVHPKIGYATWFLLGAATAEVGAFFFMILAYALSPKKRREPIRDYGEPVARNEKVDGIDYGYRNKPSSTRGSRRVHNAYDDDADSRRDLERTGSRRSHVGSERSGRRSQHRSYDDEEARSSRRERSSRRAREPESEEDDDDYEPGY